VRTVKGVYASSQCPVTVTVGCAWGLPLATARCQLQPEADRQQLRPLPLGGQQLPAARARALAAARLAAGPPWLARCAVTAVWGSGGPGAATECPPALRVRLWQAQPLGGAWRPSARAAIIVRVHMRRRAWRRVDSDGQGSCCMALYREPSTWRSMIFLTAVTPPRWVQTQGSGLVMLLCTLRVTAQSRLAHQ
jgi:hypothetical protein